MTDEEFYTQCAAIMDAPVCYQPFTHFSRTRWNNRTPGSGRYPGKGTIRLFGDTVHISLREPVALRMVVTGREKALAALAKAVP